MQRTITIVMPDDADLRATLAACQTLQQRLSPLAYNAGEPLTPHALQRAHYHEVAGTLSSQMTISCIRQVCAAYASAARTRRPATRPFTFARARALFLVGVRGRDADFRADGALSIWTVAGRTRLASTVPAAFRATLASAPLIHSLTLIERDGRLLGRVCLTLPCPDPAGVLPVGIDLNMTNALVAVDADGRDLFVSGLAHTVRTTRTRTTRRRLVQKLAARKAEGKDTRRVRRTLKRLGRKQRDRTRTFCQQTAAHLVAWSPPDAVLVFERLTRLPVSTTMRVRPGTRRRLSQWSRRLMRTAVAAAAERYGLTVADVNPAYTSQDCSRCGLRGERNRHAFACPHCGHTAHADVNAATNIRLRYTVLRGAVGHPSVAPEALPREG